MESLTWSNQEVDEKLIMSVYGQFQRPDSFSFSTVLTSWGSDNHNALIPAPGISGSFQSLDCCVLSDSITTSVEDDGISGMFSDSKNPWNFTTTVPSLSLSGNPKHCPDKHTIINQSRSSGNHNHTKTNCQNLDFHRQSTIATACHPGRTRTSFQDTSQFHPNPKKPRLENYPTSPETITLMKERIYRAAVFRPVDFTIESVQKPKRKNIRISNDPQTAAARQRRERISERIRVLQRLVPGGSKMDTASMLDEAANYLKFLRAQVRALEAFGHMIDDQTLNHFPGNLSLGLSPIGSCTFSTQNQNPVN